MPTTQDIANDETTVTPFYPSRRLAGLELELDAGSGKFHDPGTVAGWSGKVDGTCHNGLEYVLEPPLPAAELPPAIKEFCAACTNAKMHVAKCGGYHIHVQIDDYSQRDAAVLTLLYHRFQLQINTLIAPSRRSPGFQYASQYHSEIPQERTADYSQDEFIAAFQSKLAALYKLHEISPNRADARLSRQRMVLNFAMMRCRNPLERTVEFRQPSPSKKFLNVYGWACLAMSLVEVAKAPAAKAFLAKKPTWLNFLKLLKLAETRTGATNLVAWATWRRRYLSEIPDAEVKKSNLYRFLSDRARGLYSIARYLDLNMALTRELVEKEVAAGRIAIIGLKYRAAYTAVAEADLTAILKSWEPAQASEEVAATPT